VRLVDTAEIRSLNREYRRKDKATNVLSFRAAAIKGLPTDVAQALGDIVICATVVNDEAAEQGKAIDDHWAHMLVHGTLHLLGYDHETADEAAEMEGVETRILTENGLADPYRESR
jgi:probable rRNA maturation factor